MAAALAYGALAGFQLWNGLAQGEMIRRNADLSREVNEMNARYAELDAFNAELEGYSEATRYQNVIDQTVSRQREILASQNVDVNYGSAAVVQQETRQIGYINQLAIMNRANERALGYRNEAANIRLGSVAQTAQARIQETSARTSGLLQAGGTLASGYDRGLLEI